MFHFVAVVTIAQHIYLCDAISSDVIVVDKEKDDCLYVHNYLRSLHGAPPLQWNEDLANNARDWVLHLSKIGYIEHSKPNLRYRENIHHYYRGSEGYDINSAVRSWYSTIKQYDFQTNVINKKNWLALMFAVMVWDDTQTIGCAVSRDRKTKEGFVVVMYSPAVYDHSTWSYKKHIKPPKRYERNVTIDSKEIYITTLEEIANSKAHDGAHWRT